MEPRAPLYASSRVLSYFVQYGRGPLRSWFILFAIGAFILAWLSSPIWTTELFYTMIGLVLIGFGLWVHFAFPKTPPESSTAPRANHRFRRGLAPKVIVVVVALGITLALLGLATVPLEYTYSAAIPRSFYAVPGNGWEIHFPGAEKVTGGWNTSNNEVVQVKITTLSSTSVVYEENGSSGGFDLSQTAVLMYVTAPANYTANVTVIAYYWAPYWVVSP